MRLLTTAPPRVETPTPLPAPRVEGPGPLAPREQGDTPWVFTPRAREGMEERGYSVEEVVETLTRPATVYPSRREGASVATRGGMLVIHHRAKLLVLSVRGESRG